jgi:hypothetical protein
MKFGQAALSIARRHVIGDPLDIYVFSFYPRHQKLRFTIVKGLRSDRQATVVITILLLWIIISTDFEYK